MKAKDIRIGSTYLAKVSGAVVPVKVVGTRGRTVYRNGQPYSDTDDWVCRSLKTGREIVVRSPQRFRREAAATALANSPANR